MSDNKQIETPVKPWLDKLQDTDFVTDKLPYTEGKYYHLFEEKIFKTNDEVVGDLRYYVYDPTKHGYPESGTYPVIYSFHGSSASVHGITAINWAGIEYYASPEYQEKMGGAYIVCPLANEYMDGDVVKMSWMTAKPDADNKECIADYPDKLISSIKENLGASADRLFKLLGANSIYTEHLHNLFAEAVSGFTSAGKTVVFGTSAGGYCAWRYIISYSVDGALIMAPAYMPSEKELDIVDERHTKVWFCQGQYDELVPYAFSVEPILQKMTSMANVSLYLPEFVRMPDHGVYSNPAGVEMGQHCVNNAVQCDLMYDDGTPMDVLHPNGVTGWVKEFH